MTGRDGFDIKRVGISVGRRGVKMQPGTGDS